MTLSQQLMVVALIAMTHPRCSLSLPITSKPLEANPEHLTWDTRYQADGQEARKIPKSIFIAPSFNYSTCAPGYTLNPLDNKCYKEKIQLNQQSLLIQQALDAFQTASDKQQNSDVIDIGSVEYDYEDESLSSSLGTYNVPLTLGFGSDLTPAASTSTTNSKLTDTLQSSPFLNSAVVITTNSQTRRTTNDLQTTQPMGQSTVAPIVATTEMVVAKNPSADEINVPIETTTPAIQIPRETYTEIQPATTEDFFVNTIPTTTNDEEDHGGNDALNQQNRLAVAQLAEQMNNAKSTTMSTIESLDEELSKDLQEELLFRDASSPETTTFPSTTTFEPNIDPANELSTLSAQLFETTTLSDPVNSPTSTKHVKQTTADRVYVVTPETSTVSMDSVIAATELLNKESGIESEATKRQRQTVLNHEMNEDERVSIDQHNRFVYAHLASSPTEPPPATSTTTVASRTNPPTRQSLRERLNRFHRLSEENRKRLKAAHNIQPSSEIFANRRPGSATSSVRFPDPPSPASSHQRISDRSKPLFSWLPPGWTFDQTGGRPSIKAKPGLSFWNDMPLIRDPALAGVGSTDRAARANSRSPTEHLFQQEQEGEEDLEDHGRSAGKPEWHKMVLATGNARHHNR